MNPSQALAALAEVAKRPDCPANVAADILWKVYENSLSLATDTPNRGYHPISESEQNTISVDNVEAVERVERYIPHFNKKNDYAICLTAKVALDIMSDAKNIGSVSHVARKRGISYNVVYRLIRGDYGTKSYFETLGRDDIVVSTRTRQRMSADDVADILDMRENGLSYRKMSEMTGFVIGTIQRVCRGDHILNATAEEILKTRRQQSAA